MQIYLFAMHSTKNIFLSMFLEVNINVQNPLLLKKRVHLKLQEVLHCFHL